MQSAGFVTHWYLHLPSLLLAALIVLLLVRLVLTPVLGADNLVMRLLAAVTKPVVAAVGAITPRIVPPAGVLGFAMVWLAALRMAVFWVASVKGVRL
jgi:uncharacterized protein YggT (Ycf19 family)